MTIAEKIDSAKSNKYFTLSKEGFFYKCYNQDAMVFVKRVKTYKVSSKYVKSVREDLYSVGFPVGEAMACATPLVVSNVASIPEITGPFAQLIMPADADAIYRGIKNIFQNPEKYKIQADLGRQHIIEYFNWRTIGLEYEKLLYKTIDKFTC